ncbi:OLC1v1009623C1 [Oldenlandia corymbosa var. corymbosa]|uniref:OLC1v1009623C1 n=1 Tax=Oldenlandia corymbosa var. corymbosa TaxID=529605 RepID=A0AAV1DPG8_OLDCO|nr:OLC1v1009623C1 [Oldenlandia corymbosa var. corymbosa]
MNKLKKMFSTSTEIDCLREELQRLEIRSGLTFPKNVVLEFRFLKLFVSCLTNCPETGKDTTNLESLLISIRRIVKQTDILTATNLDTVSSSLLERIEHFKPNIREMCSVLLVPSLQSSKSCSSDEVLEFIGFLLGNLEGLLELKGDEIVVSLKNQIMVLQKRLFFLGNLVHFASTRCTEHQKMDDLLDYVHDWVHKAACLSLLIWLDGKDEVKGPRLESMLHNLLQKIKPYSPEGTGKFIEVLKASKSSRSDKLFGGQIVAALVDIFLEDLDDSLKDYAEVLRQGLIFMLTFLMEPSDGTPRNAGNELFAHVIAVIEELLSLLSSLYINQLKVDMLSESKTSLSAIQSKIDKVKEEVAEVYFQMPNSSDFSFPKTHGMGFIDFFLENLEKMLKCFPRSVPFAKHHVAEIKKQLVLLKPYLKDIMEFQNESEELKDLWQRVINVAYRAENAIASCSLVDHPIWYDMLCLSNVLEESKLIGREVQKFNDDLIPKMRTARAETGSSRLLPAQEDTSRLKEVVIGLKDDSQKLIERLKRGTTKLDIVSIVGMPGLGKTTLAKKLYNDPSVVYYFHKRAWCCISQTYTRRDIILDILSGICGFDARKSDSDTREEDLADKLRKALKGLKYIIFMDDIWDVEAWESIKISFPDDNNGSRIVFTSRIHNLFQQVNPNCSSDHQLRPLSDEESWELLQEKVFHQEFCPPDLSEIGKCIAKNCKGLPLSVVLVAGVLEKRSKNVDWWEQIKLSTSSEIAGEGCMNVLELSYKHLPESLKPCFLYFGAFPEDTAVRARKLMNLWIAEGLIPRTEKKSLYELAEDYLIDLIDRSLIILSERSSKGGVKACRVHDLLRDLCLLKIREDKFLGWVHNSDIPDSSSMIPKSYDIYRLFVDAGWKPFIDSNPSVPYVHSLILFGGYPGKPCQYSSTLFNSFKLLNVLDLECICLECGFPEVITSIIHLRYCAMRCHATELPLSISDLWNLETLIVVATAAEIPLPNTIWQMKSLRHICIPSMCLTGLEHHAFGQLEFLDYFSAPILNSGKETEELLGRLPGLRKLDCKFIERQFNNKPYKFPELSRLNGLESLKVYSYGPVLFGQNQYPAFDFPSSLRRLTLGRFYLPWTAISIIGQLPNLEVLKLQARAFSGRSWDVEEGEFLNLKVLELWQLEFEQWNVPDEPFPCLEQLTVKHCYSLEGIPSSLGYIPTLKKIEMHWCSKASDSARQILEEQLEMGNDGLEVIVFG